MTTPTGAPHPSPNSSLRISDTRGADFADAIRQASQQLVALDNGPLGVPVAEPAVRAFRIVRDRLDRADYDSRHGRDIRSAAAELAEVAGWALFDVEQHAAAWRANQAALALVQEAGDASMELLIRQNIAMCSEWTGHHPVALAVTRGVLAHGALSPRVEAIFRVREAKGLAGLAYTTGAVQALSAARSLLEDGTRESDPYWAWWVTPEEIDGHLGHVLQDAGRTGEAIEVFQRVVYRPATVPVGHAGMSDARLLDCLLRERAWRDADALTRQVIAAVRTRSSQRVHSEFGRAAERGRRHRDAPPACVTP